MLSRFKKKIKFYRKKKYQNIIFKKEFILERKCLIEKILNLNQKKINRKKIICCDKNFFKMNLNKKNFPIFYKKFNYNLKLKKNYNLKTFKKTSNIDACFCSYIYFYKYVKYSKLINNIHKLNTILKLNDLLIIIYEPNKHSDYKKEFEQILNYEKELIKKFL